MLGPLPPLPVPHLPALTAILVVVVLKWYVMMASMRMVSKSYLCKNTKVVAEYMKHKDNNLGEPFDPVTMEGYRYMVAGEKYCCVKRAAAGGKPWYEPDSSCLKKVTTVEQIWQCKGSLLLHERRRKTLKDLCLSMALSKMLNRRFAGFEFSEAELGKTRDFVFKGLLPSSLGTSRTSGPSGSSRKSLFLSMTCITQGTLTSTERVGSLLSTCLSSCLPYAPGSPTACSP